MLIAQISDTHIAPRGQKTCGVAPMAENLVRCIDSLNALDPRPDLVLLTGDVTHSGTREETHHARELLSALEAPLYVVPGNHDDRAILAQVFGHEECPSNSGGFVDYVIEGYPLRIIALDTLDAGKPGGRIGEARLDWLRARLEEGGSRPTLLATHHPPLKLGVPETDVDGFAGAEALGEIVAAHPNIERLLCGHIHLHTSTRWQGTIVMTAPSPGMRLAPEPKNGNTSRFLLSCPEYLLHQWTPDCVLVTHPMQLPKPEGPFDFV